MGAGGHLLQASSPTQPQAPQQQPQPTYLARLGGFLTDIPESEEEEEDEVEDDDGDLTGGTGSALLRPIPMESESDADGTFWRRGGQGEEGGWGAGAPSQMETPSSFWVLNQEAQAAAIHPVRGVGTRLHLYPPLQETQ